MEMREKLRVGEKRIGINSGGGRGSKNRDRDGVGLPGKLERTRELQHTPYLLSSTGYLHDLGIIHRDVKVELSAFCLYLRGLSKFHRYKVGGS